MQSNLNYKDYALFATHFLFTISAPLEVCKQRLASMNQTINLRGESMIRDATITAEVSSDGNPSYRFKIVSDKRYGVRITARGVLVEFDKQTATVEGKADVPADFYPKILTVFMAGFFGLLFLTVSLFSASKNFQAVFAIMILYIIGVRITGFLYRHETRKLADQIQAALRKSDIV
jgi:hypothetical protein